MKKKWNALLGAICYTLGVFSAIYVGGWLMLIVPIKTLMAALTGGVLTIKLLTKCILLIAFSSTFGGLVWCIGYIGYNHFRGTDDPDWNEVEQRWKDRIQSNDKTDSKKEIEEEK